MGIYLTPLEVDHFQRLVRHNYQAKGNKLRPHCQFEGGVIGKTTRFDRYGQVEAHEVGSDAANDPSTNPQLTPVEVTLRDWSAKIYTSKFRAPKILFNDMEKAAQATAMAMARRSDQEMINALAAATPNDTVGTEVGGGATNMNKEKALEAKAVLDEDSVDEGNRVAIIGARQLKSLLLEAEATSSDYVETKPLRDGQIAHWAGFMWVVIPNMKEGGLPIANGVRDCFFYDPNALGLAEGLAIQTIISWENPRTAHLINCIWSGASVAIEDGTEGGIVKVQCTDAAGPAA